MDNNSGKCVQYHYQSINNHCNPSEVGLNITKPSEKTLKPYNFGNIMRLEFIRTIPEVNRSNSRRRNNPIYQMILIKDDSNATKGYDMIEQTNPDGTSKIISRQEHVRDTHTHHPFPSG